MSLAEFDEAEETPGYRYELARGVVEVVEVPGDDHGQVVDNAHELLSRYRREHPDLIRRIGHGSDIRYLIPELESDRNPDLAVVFRDAPRDARRRLRAGLAVEIVSAGKRARDRDYVAKREEYLAVGVREYWIIDPSLRQVTVLVRREAPAGPSWEERVFRGDEVIQGEALPGFAGIVAELWADVEAAGEQ
jgi:Uma2 family endonuclease